MQMRFHTTVSQVAPRNTTSFDVSITGVVTNANLLKYRITRHQPNNRLQVLEAGRPFNMADAKLRAVGFPRKSHSVSSLTESSFNQFVFVTAASGNHFREALDAIATVQRYFPKHVLYYYDLDTKTRKSTFKKVRT
jgi:hypothetical protein